MSRHLLTVILLALARGGPRSKRLLLGPAHVRSDGGNQNSGCRLVALLLIAAPALLALAGLAAGLAYGSWS